MNISNKKKKSFDEIFYLRNANNFVLIINKFRELFESDFYTNFILYIDLKISNLILTEKNFFLHVEISSFNISDMYYYTQILEFAKLLNKYSSNLSNIYIYNNSSLFANLISMINNSLGLNINEKLIFSDKKIKNEMQICNQQVM